MQDNHSRSTRGVVRGLHFQVGAGVAKLVRCARGRILDVGVDLRRGSPTYGRWEAVELDDESMRELYVPVGFAHGFCALSEVADVIYKQTAYYDPELERGIAWDDPQIGDRLAARRSRADRLRARRGGAALERDRRRAAVRVASLTPMHARLQRLRARTNGYTVTPRSTSASPTSRSAALTLIVLTGAAVRLTGSGLGCPTWPKCYGNVYPPLNTHAVIEFSNRVISVPVLFAAGFAWLGALRRRPYRRDLMWLGALLPLGVVAQAVLGGFTVKGALDYGWVMGHFALSMLILVAAALLAWRASHADLAQGEDAPTAAPAASARPAAAPGRSVPRASARSCWRCAGWRFGALTIFAGTAATAAGPHAGGSPGQKINRLNFDGHATMDFVIHRHAEIAFLFSVAAVALWWFARKRGAAREIQRPLTVLCVLLALQGAVGLDQYETHLPTELVWVHVGLACGAWLSVLWATFAAGPLAVSAAPKAPPSARGGPAQGLRTAGVPRKLGLFALRPRRICTPSSS